MISDQVESSVRFQPPSGCLDAANKATFYQRFNSALSNRAPCWVGIAKAHVRPKTKFTLQDLSLFLFHFTQLLAIASSEKLGEGYQEKPLVLFVASRLCCNTSTNPVFKTRGLPLFYNHEKPSTLELFHFLTTIFPHFSKISPLKNILQPSLIKPPSSSIPTFTNCSGPLSFPPQRFNLGHASGP